MGYVMRSPSLYRRALAALGQKVPRSAGPVVLITILATAAAAQTTGPVGPGAPAAKSAKGQKAQPAAAVAAKPDPAAAERAMESGIKFYEGGKNDVAAATLSGAMQGGALPGPKMARALYYRGLAYKKLGKPAQAISDLTSALWLKGGLSEGERTDALAQREAAYREAGIASAPAVTTTAAKANPSTATPAKATASAQSATTAAAVAPVQTAEAAKPAESTSGNSITGFFGGLFGGGSTASAAPPASAGAATTTGTLTPPPPEPAASSWNSTTKASSGVKPTAPPVAAAPTPAAQTKVAAAPTSSATAAPTVAEGKFRLQVAAVRSREEANAVAARLKKDFAKKIGGREPIIDEAAIGNMGTFYRVRVGPYASANEPRQLCITLRASAGFDCLVVTQ